MKLGIKDGLPYLNNKNVGLRPDPKLYTLIAQNESGTVREVTGQSPHNARKRYDEIYSREGFKIEIFDEDGQLVKIIKKSYK